MYCYKSNNILYYKNISIARIIMDAKDNEKVLYLDRNNYNLRKNNLIKVSKNKPNNFHPNKIIEYDNYIGVIANNSNNEHKFPKNTIDCIKNYSWNEDKVGRLYIEYKNKVLYAYWFVVGEPIRGYVVDHIDMNVKNNLKNNLRIVNKGINNQHQYKCKNNTSGFIGVSWHKSTNKWRSAISFNKKHIHIGLFNNTIEAAKAYDNAAIKYYGENATTNEKLNLYIKLLKENNM